LDWKANATHQAHSQTGCTSLVCQDASTFLYCWGRRVSGDVSCTWNPVCIQESSHVTKSHLRRLPRSARQGKVGARY
jgi:hypothetical protein